MGQKPRNTLKGYFLRGSKPLASQFSDLIDSFVHKDDASNSSDAPFTDLVGTAWDGTSKRLTLTANTALILSTTNTEGALIISQDGTGSRTLTINGTSITIQSAANSKTLVCYLKDATAYYFFVSNISSTGGGSGGGGTTYDTDAQAYFTAAGITDTTFKTAYNNFVVAAKANGYYAKIKALFPFAPGHETYDAITATNKITWSGGTRSNGADFNGTSDYGDLGVNPSIAAQDGLGFFAYAMENIDQVVMGANGSDVQTYLYYNGSNLLHKNNNLSSAVTTIPLTAAAGFFANLRTGPSTQYAYHDATLLNTVSEASQTPTTNNFFIGANNGNGTANTFSTSKLGGVGVFDGFSQANWLAFKPDFQTFLTAVSR